MIFQLILSHWWQSDLVLWWRHQMETFSALLAICAGNSPSPVNSPHKGQWHGALMFSLFCAWINGWVNNGEAGDLRRHLAHYDVIVMSLWWQRCYQQEDVALKDIHLTVILNSNLAKSCLPVSNLSKVSFWNFAQSSAIIRPCSVQNSKTIQKLT